MLVVAASFCWSLTDIMIKTLSKSHHAFVNTFYFALFSALCTLPFAIIFWRLPSAYEFAMLAFLGSLFVFNIYSVTKAYENAELTIMMPFAFTQLIFIAILSYIVFGEVMTMTTAIGSMIIIGSTSYIAYREKKRHNLMLKTPHHDI
jgi:drug/metabolite transporter (DMT)-like permease